MKQRAALWASPPTLLLAMLTAANLRPSVPRSYGPGLVFIVAMVLYSVLLAIVFVLLWQAKLGRRVVLPMAYVLTGTVLGHDLGAVGAGAGAVLAATIWLVMQRGHRHDEQPPH